jgi:patatin-like phospholipase/acyl hydrolase
MIAGTSTGGILTCLYLCPDKDGRPRFSAEDAVNLYVKKGGDIFDVSVWQKLRSVGGVMDEKYSEKPLEKTLSGYFDDLKMSSLLKPCLVTCYDIEARCSRFLTQHDAKRDVERDFYVKNVARATSAAPTYFEVAELSSVTGQKYHVIDGGVFANNPALCSYAEARTEFNVTAANMAVLSIGTGNIEHPYEYNKAKNWGLAAWVKPVLDIMMGGVAETIDYQLRQIFSSVNKPGQYLRINSILNKADYSLDDASDENISALVEDGSAIADQYDSQLDEFVKLLVD